MMIIVSDPKSLSMVMMKIIVIMIRMITIKMMMERQIDRYRYVYACVCSTNNIFKSKLSAINNRFENSRYRQTVANRFIETTLKDPSQKAIFITVNVMWYVDSTKSRLQYGMQY